jgi:hypothetical protein
MEVSYLKLILNLLLALIKILTSMVLNVHNVYYLFIGVYQPMHVKNVMTILNLIKIHEHAKK